MELIAGLYTLLLRLYPGSFRREFGEEMQEVFSRELEEAAMRGRSSLAGVFLRELERLPASLLALFEAWVRSPMPEGASLERESPASGSWTCALLAGVPHLLFAMSLYLPLWLTAGLGLPDYRGPSVPLFWGLVLAVLFFARSMGWPRWSASWVGYGLVLLLTQSTLLFKHGPFAILAGIAWLLLSAVVLFWLARRDWMAGLLAILPITPMWIWLTRLYGFPAALEPLTAYFSLSLVVTFVVIAIVRLGRWQTALLLLLLVILATGLPEANGLGSDGRSIWTENYSYCPKCQTVWDVSQFDINGLNEAGGWLAGYLGILFLTAPLWLMALWRQAQRRWPESRADRGNH